MYKDQVQTLLKNVIIHILLLRQNKREFKNKDDFIKQFKINAKKNKSLVFSKFKAMDMVGRLINSRNKKHEVVDALAAYAMSESKDSGPYVIDEMIKDGLMKDHIEVSKKGVVKAEYITYTKKKWISYERNNC